MDGWMDGLVEWIGFGPAGTQPSESITTEPRKPYSHEFDKVMYILRGDGKECWAPECCFIGSIYHAANTEIGGPVSASASHHVFARGITRCRVPRPARHLSPVEAHQHSSSITDVDGHGT
jgi:hypothetical protein